MNMVRSSEFERQKAMLIADARNGRLPSLKPIHIEPMNADDRARKAKLEYRVVWKRRGQHRKQKRFASLKAAERRVRLLGPEPWTAFHNVDPDAPWCNCGGMCHDCQYKGETFKQKLLRERAEGTIGDPDGGMPDLEYVRIESRELGAWSPQPGGGKP